MIRTHISHDAAASLFLGERFKRTNTEIVRYSSGDRAMLLHGNLIAMYSPDSKKLFLNNAGYKTQTTKERLNAVLEVFNINAKIYQRKKVWYIDINGITLDFPWKKDLVFNIDQDIEKY